MRPDDFKRTRQALGLTQEQLAEKLRTTRRSIIRYEDGTRRIPGMAEVLLRRLATNPEIAMAGVVAAGEPIEPIAQAEVVDVPPSMVGKGEPFALRVKGTSMQEEGILPGDLVVVRKQQTASNGEIVVALVNHEATIKRYYRRGDRVELHPANAVMQPIIVGPADDFRIEGIVTGVIRHYR